MSLEKKFKQFIKGLSVSDADKADPSHRRDNSHSILLNQAVQEPEQELAILEGATRIYPQKIFIHKLIEEILTFNNNQTPLAKEIAIWEEARSGDTDCDTVSLKPSNTNTKITFTELNTLANRLARCLVKMILNHDLLKSGSLTQSESVVAVILPLSAQLVAVILCLIKIGLPALIIDPSVNTESQISAKLSSAQPIAVLLSSSDKSQKDPHKKRYSLHKTDLLCSSEFMILFFEQVLDLAGSFDCNDLQEAEMLFSGDNSVVLVNFSSGAGSGELCRMCVRHSHLLNALNWCWEMLPWQSHDILLMCESAERFDCVVWLLSALLQGIPVVLAEPDSSDWCLQEWLLLVSAKYVTRALLSQFQLCQLLSFVGAAGDENVNVVSALLSLESILITNDNLSPHAAQAFFKHFSTGKSLLYYLYSPKTSIFACGQIYRCLGDVYDKTHNNLLSVGCPAFNTLITVSNSNQEILRNNKFGQIIISTKNLDLDKKKATKTQFSFTFENSLRTVESLQNNFVKTASAGFILNSNLYISKKLEEDQNECWIELDCQIQHLVSNSLMKILRKDFVQVLTFRTDKGTLVIVYENCGSDSFVTAVTKSKLLTNSCRKFLELSDTESIQLIETARIPKLQINHKPDLFLLKSICNKHLTRHNDNLCGSHSVSRKLLDMKIVEKIEQLVRRALKMTFSSKAEFLETNIWQDNEFNFTNLMSFLDEINRLKFGPVYLSGMLDCVNFVDLCVFLQFSYKDSHLLKTKETVNIEISTCKVEKLNFDVNTDLNLKFQDNFVIYLRKFRDLEERVSTMKVSSQSSRQILAVYVLNKMDHDLGDIPGGEVSDINKTTFFVQEFYFKSFESMPVLQRIRIMDFCERRLLQYCSEIWVVGLVRKSCNTWIQKLCADLNYQTSPRCSTTSRLSLTITDTPQRLCPLSESPQIQTFRFPDTGRTHRFNSSSSGQSL